MTSTLGKVAAGVAAAAIVVAGTVGVVTQANNDNAPTANVAAATPVFSANFATPGDFFDRFDYAFSGLWIPAAGSLTSWQGDHAADPSPSCSGPNTSRTVTMSGSGTDSGTSMDYSQAFYWCAPSGDGSSGHMMTVMTTTGYNHLWFSPKPEFTGIQKVCWDINETTEAGKWTEVQFVDHADATRYPTGMVTMGGNARARGNGGFDLGYTDPEFQDQNGPSNGLFSSTDNIAGIKIGFGSIFDWWQHQSTFAATGIGWPGLLPGAGTPPNPVNTDKATRFTTCVENLNSSQIQITNARPDGTFTYVITGQIPQDARRVVFHDAEYDGVKRDGYDPNRITWHWDNIQIFTAQGPTPPPTTVPPPPTTTVPPTVPLTSTIPTTTIPTTTTTVKPTTTLPPTTTTTVPATTTTTLAPIPPCPVGFTTAQAAWCKAVNAHIAALEAKVH